MTTLYIADVYGIQFVAETERDVHILVEDYVLDELAGVVQKYEVKEVTA